MLLGLDSPAKLLLFIGYITLWTNQVVLSHFLSLSSLKFNSTTLVLLTDLAKLLLSILLYLGDSGSGVALLRDVRMHWRLCLLYIVPAGMYALYNNMAFVALGSFDPATYSILLQLRIVATALLSMVILNRVISWSQWLALVIIMAGSMVKEGGSLTGQFVSHGLGDYAILLLQILLSAGAGVYTEKLLRGKTDASTNLQNIFMYVNGLALNVVSLVIRGTSPSVIVSDAASSLTHFVPVVLILNSALSGVVTGFFLKTLGSVLKTIAAALEIPAIAVISFLVFGYPVNAMTSVSVMLVFAGVLVYSLPIRQSMRKIS